MFCGRSEEMERVWFYFGIKGSRELLVIPSRLKVWIDAGKVFALGEDELATEDSKF